MLSDVLASGKEAYCATSLAVALGFLRELDCNGDGMPGAGGGEQPHAQSHAQSEARARAPAALEPSSPEVELQ